MGSSFTEKLLGALNAFFEAVMRFLPGFLAALLIFALGLIAAWLAELLLKRALKIARFDRLADSLGATQVLARADVRSTPSSLAARFFFWVILASFLMAGLSALGLQAIDRLTSEFFLYLPRIFAAFLILLVGFLFSNFFSRAALLAAVNTNLPSPRGISLVVKLLIAILAFAMALEQLQIAKSIVLAAFIISFGAVMLGLAIAFGVGGKEVAREMLEHKIRERKKAADMEEISHL